MSAQEKNYKNLTMPQSVVSAILERTENNCPDNTKVVRAFFNHANQLAGAGNTNGAKSYMKPIGPLSHLKRSTSDLEDEEIIQLDGVGPVILEFIRSKE